MTLEQEMYYWAFYEDEKENVRDALNNFDYERCLLDVIEYIKEQKGVANNYEVSIDDFHHIACLRNIIEQTIDIYNSGVAAANSECMEFLEEKICSILEDRGMIEFADFDKLYFRPPREYFLV